jgi:S1-C subfamily serine protease
MNPILAFTVMALSPGAPVPKEPMPNPLGWSYMGVQIQNLDQGPLRIAAPEPGTPAYKAGLKDGDILLKIGKIEPLQFNEVIRYIFELRPGTVIAVQVRRGGELVTVQMRLEERPTTPLYRLPDFIQRVNPNLPIDDD